MTDTARTPAQLSVDVASEDVVVGSANGDSIVSGATWTVDVQFNDDVLFVIKSGGSSATVSIGAGNEPPSPKAIKGAYSFTVASGEVKLVVPEKGRHITTAGKIVVTVTTQTCICSAYRMPPGFVAPLVTYNGILNS